MHGVDKGEIVLRNANLQELMHMLQEQYGVTANTRLDLQLGSYTVRLPTAMPFICSTGCNKKKISYKPKNPLCHEGRSTYHLLSYRLSALAISQPTHLQSSQQII